MFLGFVTQNVKTGYESVLWCVRGIFVLRIQYTKLEIKERWILEKNECLMKGRSQCTFISNSKLQPIEKPIKENRGGHSQMIFTKSLFEKRKK